METSTSGHGLDIERLIAEVKKRPVLYDKKCSTYRRASVTELAWTGIAEAVNMKVESCKKRWKSLRDNFIKHYRMEMQPNQQQSQAVRRLWPYYERLLFLRDHVEVYRLKMMDGSKWESRPASPDMTVQKVEEASNESIYDESQPEYYEIDEEMAMTMVDLDEQNVQELQSEEASSAPRKRPSTRKTSETCGFEAEHPQPIVDPDERFLLSCAPVLQRLSKKKNALVRLKIQQLLYQVEFENEDTEQAPEVAVIKKRAYN
ncbi:uncharacterized protein LOC131207950 [Anopheles bellator]|uniref:uncharacterized protein LOC131207950 n=1 Tax=Anopheles bellator TaxID=139047 RepID=UPI0026476A24|nr:uncharacterized protein LOC131207950 [Anopheles bellator]